MAHDSQQLVKVSVRGSSENVYSVHCEQMGGNQLSIVCNCKYTSLLYERTRNIFIIALLSFVVVIAPGFSFSGKLGSAMDKVIDQVVPGADAGSREIAKEAAKATMSLGQKDTEAHWEKIDDGIQRQFSTGPGDDIAQGAEYGEGGPSSLRYTYKMEFIHQDRPSERTRFMPFDDVAPYSAKIYYKDGWEESVGVRRITLMKGEKHDLVDVMGSKFFIDGEEHGGVAWMYVMVKSNFGPVKRNSPYIGIYYVGPDVVIYPDGELSEKRTGNTYKDL